VSAVLGLATGLPILSQNILQESECLEPNTLIPVLLSIVTIEVKPTSGCFKSLLPSHEKMNKPTRLSLLTIYCCTRIHAQRWVFESYNQLPASILINLIIIDSKWACKIPIIHIVMWETTNLTQGPKAANCQAWGTIQ
jgi:hypothetical protein